MPSVERPCQIMLVEDNPMDVELTRRAFSISRPSLSFEVVKDGEEALGQIRKWDEGSPLPVFILLDLKLPKVDGLQVLRELKSHPRYRSIPVIVLTTSSEDRDVETAYRLGVNSYLVKEIDFDKFMQIAAEVGRYWCDLNILPRR